MNITFRKIPVLTAAFAVLISAIAAVPQADAQAGFRVNKNLYSETANASADIAAAEAAARHDRKRILLDFGGNWCGDCQVLDYYYHQAPNAELLAKYYVVVHIDIGHIDKNLDIAEKYHVPVAHGVPSLGILDDRGKVLYAERAKEFEHTSPEAVAAFLNHWKG